jgi:hypothetical protein
MPTSTMSTVKMQTYTMSTVKMSTVKIVDCKNCRLLKLLNIKMLIGQIVESQKWRLSKCRLPNYRPKNVNTQLFSLPNLT